MPVNFVISSSTYFLVVACLSSVGALTNVTSPVKFLPSGIVIPSSAVTVPLKAVSTVVRPIEVRASNVAIVSCLAVNTCPVKSPLTPSAVASIGPLNTVSVPAVPTDVRASKVAIVSCFAVNT